MTRTRLGTRDYKHPSRRTIGADLRFLKPYFIGALIGAGIFGAATLYVLQRNHPNREESGRPRPQRAPAPIASSDSAAAAAPDKAERYDFYEMLPNFEVVVPEKEREVQRDVPAAHVQQPGVYVLQAGSYRNEADAQRVRGKIAMLGVDAAVQRVAVDNDVWHRVRIGPISKLDDVNRLRKRLQAAEIDTIVIRVGD